MKIQLWRLGALVLVALISVGAVSIEGGNHVQASSEQAAADVMSKSKALTQRPPLPDHDAADKDPRLRLGGEALLMQGAIVEAQTPLPEGSPAFDWTRWEGTISAEGVERVAEHHAVCAWYASYLSAVSDDRRATAARAIIADLASWPTFRGRRSGAQLQEVAGTLDRGGASRMQEYLAINCR